MFHDFINLFYPKICYSCETVLLMHEHIICTQCLHALPIKHNHTDNANATKKVFYGGVEIQQATSLLLFEKKESTATYS